MKISYSWFHLSQTILENVWASLYEYFYYLPSRISTREKYGILASCFLYVMSGFPCAIKISGIVQWFLLLGPQATVRSFGDLVKYRLEYEKQQSYRCRASLRMVFHCARTHYILFSKCFCCSDPSCTLTWLHHSQHQYEQQSLSIQDGQTHGSCFKVSRKGRWKDISWGLGCTAS